MFKSIILSVATLISIQTFAQSNEEFNGCMEARAYNYDARANIDKFGSCFWSACLDEDYEEYSSKINQQTIEDIKNYIVNNQEKAYVQFFIWNVTVQANELKYSDIDEELVSEFVKTSTCFTPKNK
ncbi:MAG: hypothetical protein H6621_11205 [Halobacteriovoraceae bacterium]|nr:hypothetical protein [Halobacteriovoraceae bacterium]MCB9095626.1 hypothetical protein [Halobacteriovoraceae bacterium]